MPCDIIIRGNLCFRGKDGHHPFQRRRLSRAHFCRLRGLVAIGAALSVYYAARSAIGSESYSQMRLLAWLFWLGALGTACVAEAEDGSGEHSFAQLSVSVSATCAYTIDWPEAGWRFRGKVPEACVVERRTGRDALGAFEEFQLTGQDEARRIYVVRAYPNRSSVVFTVSGHDRRANSYQFPIFESYPAGLMNLSYKREAFSPITFDLTGDAPWLFFDQALHSYILSPLNHFMIANNSATPTHGLAVGIEPQVNEVADSFSFRSILVVGDGINSTYHKWGQLLTDFAGKVRPANDADPILSTLGYWTDNRSSYWYNYVKAKGYLGTLKAIVKEFAVNNIKLGHLQLDSWWYSKAGDPPSWTNFKHGIYVFQAAPELFPHGLAEFQQSIGLPLINHSRWLDSESPYSTRYQLSGQVAIDPSYWEMVMSYLAQAGVKAYEQDWLDKNALPRLDRIKDAELFLDEMAKAASNHGLGLQYCMPLPRHFLQSTRYDNLYTIRPSGDGLVPEKWQQFLFGSTLASALGIWPWTDVFFSAVRENLLLATLSGGIVGVGDRLSSGGDANDDYKPTWCGHDLACSPLDVGNLRHAIRADGVVIKPDVPLSPLDESYWRMARDPNNIHAVAAAAFSYEDGGVSAAYVFGFAPKGAKETSLKVDPSSLGFHGPVIAYAYWQGNVKLINPSQYLDFTPGTTGQYWVLVPLRGPELAMLGNLDTYATMGKKRVHVVKHDGTWVVTNLTFAEGETVLRLSGWTRSGVAPRVQTRQLKASLISMDPQTNVFTFEFRRSGPAGGEYRETVEWAGLQEK
jgi:hypothetical protein